jgi:hypothetical protein
LISLLGVFAAQAICKSGPPPYPTRELPSSIFVAGGTEFSFEVVTPITTTEAPSFELIPTFPAGRFTVEGEPSEYGPIYSGKISDFRGAVIPGSGGNDGNHLFVKISTRLQPKGEYVIVVQFRDGEGACASSYRFAVGRVTLI